MSTPAGYSKKSLVEKLGIKTGFRIAIMNAPENYLAHTLLDLPPAVVTSDALDGAFDLIQFFTTETEILTEQFAELKEHLEQTGSLWISWPKGSSKVPTNLNENIVREIGLDGGLVDVKVCAVDAIWSGLKFVYRLTDRAPKPVNQ